MNLHSYIKEIRKYGKRSFTLKELLEQFPISRNYARVALHRLMQSGDLISPARGFYVIVPPEHQLFGSIPAEELIPLLMKYLNADYYVGLLSAAAFHGATHQKPARFQVVSNKRIKHSLSFGKVQIELIYKESLLGLPTQDFVVSTGYLKISTPELTALDLFKYPKHSAGISHTATVLSELVESIDAHKLIVLAKNIGELPQVQRIGYVVEKIDVMDEKKKARFIATLLNYVQKSKRPYIPLVPYMPQKEAVKCKKWNIIENTDFESDL